jgi:hypothetical protein
MRRYDDPVEVRKGLVGSGSGPGGSSDGPGDSSGDGVEGPEQFLWRGRLWKVRDVLAHWVETGPWWQSSGVHAVLGADAEDTGNRDDSRGGLSVRADLLAEREVWRVEAGRGMAGTGIFDLVFDWSTGSWALTRCVD